MYLYLYVSTCICVHIPAHICKREESPTYLQVSFYEFRSLLQVSIHRYRSLFIPHLFLSLTFTSRFIRLIYCEHVCVMNVLCIYSLHTRTRCVCVCVCVCVRARARPRAGRLPLFPLLLCLVDMKHVLLSLT